MSPQTSLPSHSAIASRMMGFSRVAAVASALIGAMVLVGWKYDILFLKSLGPGLNSMKSNTALAVLLSGFSLWFLVGEFRSKCKNCLGFACALLVILIGGLTISEIVFQQNFGIDQLLFVVTSPGVGTTSPGRMSLSTALCLILLGLSLLLLDRKFGRRHQPSQFMALAAGIVSLVALIGYAYDVQVLYGLAPFSTMALHTGIALFILSTGIVLARPRAGFMVLISQDDAGGALMRGLLPAAFGIPILLGWLRLKGQWADLYDTEAGTMLLVPVNIICLVIFIHIAVSRINRLFEDLRQAQAGLARKLTELKRSNDELEQFAYVASHDLQEPLRVVASYTELLARRYKGRLDSDADEFIAYAVDGAKRMRRLIEDLLAYSRAGTNGKTASECSSENALREALSNLRGVIEESGAIVTHDSLPAVLANELQLVQVFQNLVGNAIKYRSGEVPRIHVTASENGGTECVFSVQDNGLGIDSQHFDRIFVIFQRLHGRGEFAGTGIGLAICKKIVERQGGRIWVESQLQKGSTFHFAVPGGDGK